MSLHSITLKNFRNHLQKEFTFSKTTLIIGRNTAGKTNILEAAHLLSYPKSHRAEKDVSLITHSKDFARIDAAIKNDQELKRLAIIISKQNSRVSKKFLVENIPRRQVDFASNFTSVLFTPIDLEIITDTPSARRKYFDSILYKSNKRYRQTVITYEKILRHRNKMLQDIKSEKKLYTNKEFEYWNNQLLSNAKIISEKRQELTDSINKAEKNIFQFFLSYEKNEASQERLEKYYEAERAVGQTLVGPTRDDFIFYFPDKENTIKEFASRGQQRLAILQTKLLELQILTNELGQKPTLLLDDIFSELDENNIKKIHELIGNQQTIITTTHKELIPEKVLSKNSTTTISL